jgi:hypothetical protein
MARIYLPLRLLAVGLLLLSVIAPVLSHAAEKTDAAPSAVRAASAAPVRPSRSAAEFEGDDELEGIETSADGELLLEDADETAAAEASAKAASPLDVFNDPAVSPIPPGAFDKERVASSLDWLHVHYEARIASAATAEAEAADADHSNHVGATSGRLLDSSRKLGRSPLQFQLGQQQVPAAIEAALSGARIGDKRQVTLTREQVAAAADAAQLPTLPALDEEVETVQLTLELVRFDLDVKPLTMVDRSVGSLRVALVLHGTKRCCLASSPFTCCLCAFFWLCVAVCGTYCP